jgi:hypothetical protein
MMFLALAMANDVFAQDQAEPSGRFYGPLVSGAWAAKTPQVTGQKLFHGVLPRTVVQPQPATSPCSVPLLEAQIPKDGHFTIRQLSPQMDKLAPMPQAKVPAPSCDFSSPR